MRVYKSIPVHALEGVVPGLAGVVDGDIVPPVCLVNVNITLRKDLLFVTPSEHGRGWSRLTFSPR